MSGPRRPRVGVTGPGGYLGRRLEGAVRAAGAELVRLGRAEGVELTDPASVAAALGAIRLDAVVHTAAANPGRPEADFQPVNVGGAAAVAGAAARHGVRLVSVSTDVVLDGRSAPYDDDAPVSPLNAYGRSKADGEAAVLARCPDAAVVRTSLIYGVHEPDRSTAGFLARLAGGEELRLFADVIRQPVFVDALADGLVQLALEQREVSGTLNLAGRQPVDRATFGRRLLRFWGVEPGPMVLDVSAAELPDVPLDLRLHLGRAQALGLPCPGVDEVLAGR